MTEEEERMRVESKQVWNEIFAFIMELSEQDRKKVFDFASILRTLVNVNKQAGIVALALVGTECAMKVKGEGD